MNAALFTFKMKIRYQIFIIVAIICSSYTVLINGINSCDCDDLQIQDPDGDIGNQNFTKQNDTHNTKPYYFSIQRNMLSWKVPEKKWSYEVYNSTTKKFESRRNYGTATFSFENGCEKRSSNLFDKNNNPATLISQCLKDNSNCLATKEFTKNFLVGNKSFSSQVLLHAKNPCKFPFSYKEVTYHSCTKKDHEKFWCGTEGYDKDHQSSWGFCSTLCPMEKHEVAVKSWHIVVGIFVGISLIIAVIFGYYRFIMTKKDVENGKAVNVWKVSIHFRRSVSH